MPGDSARAATLAPVDLRRITKRESVSGERRAGFLAVVPGQDLRRKAGGERSAPPRVPSAREAEHGDPADPSKPGTAIIAAYRSFNVASPAIARIEAMIQKRMTTVGSSHPFCSK